MSRTDEGSPRSLPRVKQALLEKRLRQGDPGQGKPRGIAVRREQSHIPLSFAQQRLWFFDQLEPGSPVYNRPSHIRLTGSLDEEALERSLNEIVRRHEVLRTAFVSVDGSPCQVVAPARPLSLPVVDLQHLPEPERAAQARRLASEEARRSFDLAHGPLLRAALLRLDDEEQVLLLTMHHIVFDGWSMGVLLRELGTLYQAFTAGRPSPLPQLPIQHGDFAAWQRQWFQGEVLERQLAYWKRQLAGAPAVLELPTDHPRPAERTYRGAGQSLVLSQSLSERLKGLSCEEGVTLFMTFLAAFQTLLARYTGQEDVVVGAPTAGRLRAETEELIGCFINTLMLRTDVSGNPTFRELLGRVRRTALSAYAHQDLPFEKLVEELQPERHLSQTPLFQVMLNFRNLPKPAIEVQGLRIEDVEVDDDTAIVDLTLEVSEKPEGLRCLFKYSAELFEAATIKRMLGHFQTLLEGIMTNPGQRLSRLPLLTPAEQYQLLVEWNSTQTEYPEYRCLHELFEAQVKRTPEAMAVMFEKEQLTYRELNRRANQVAHYLRKRGVGPEVLVGICLERSLEMVVGLLGILKAGGAYVPLNPADPQGRLSFMLKDAQVPVLLTQERLLERLPESEAEVVCLDTGWKMMARESTENPRAAVTPDNLAYVLYTSGSTGRPKGVLVEQRQLINYVFAVFDRLDLAPGASFAMVQPLTVDSCNTVIYPSLFTGGCLHLVSRERAVDAQRLGEYFRRHEINCLKIAPSHLAALQTSAHPEQVLPRNWLVLGGEPAHWDFVRSLQSLAPDGLIFNHYGPTETTVGVLTYRVGKGETGRRSAILPIGRPVANTQIYLLDRHLQPVPIGVPGELHIGGAGLARGYLKCPELTAEKFTPNPFSLEPGARLYQTGDLTRYLPDGQLEFLGRVDQQVKVRGFRIELGEIEAVLGQHPSVRERVVIVREDEPGDKRLVAYLVSAQEQTLSLSELRGYVKEKLPEYMVPSTFVLLDELPLTPHGKVDRRALPVPDRIRPELEGSLVTPRTPAEEALSGIWADVFRLEQVGIHDNFFELGGDSILSIQIIAKANQAGLRLTPKQLFQHQTIAGLAAVVNTAPVIAVEQGPVTGAVPLTPIQRWFFERDLPERHHFNQAFLLEARRALDPALLERVVEHLLMHHDALRLRFVREGTEWQQVNAGVEENPVFSRVDLSALPETEQGRAIEATAAELQASLNLSEGPLVRLALFDLGPRKAGRLLLAIHHLAVDGVSWRVLLEDLQTAYRQLSQGEAIQLAPKTASFKHWAERLMERARSGAFEPELAYWLAESRAQVSRLPVDYPGGANTLASARTVSAWLSVEETRALLQEVPAAYRTQINDVLLTALVQSLARWTGAPSLLLDLEGHGREEILEQVDLSRTVGWFTTIFPVRLELGGSDLGAALKSVKEQLRGIPNRGIGYGWLRYLSGKAAIAEKLRALPQAEAIFNYLGQYDQMFPASSLFRWAEESSGAARSLQGSRSHLLAISGSIRGGRLELSWSYSENVHRRATVEGLAQGFIAALRSLIAHCQSVEAGSYTPSDFPLARIDQQALNELSAEIERIDKAEEYLS